MKHILKAGATAGVRMLVAYFAYLIKYSRNPKKYPLELRYKRIQNLSRYIAKQLGADVVILGEENIPNEVSCFFPNHQSAFDPLILYTILKNPSSCVAKKEIYKYFMLGRAARTLESEFIDRDNLRQSLKLMNRVKDDLEARNKNWIIFAEGTRRKDTNLPLLPFHYGSFKSAMAAKVPIVPVAIYGTFRILKTKPEHKKYPIHVSFLKPIMPEEYIGLRTDQIAIKVQNAVQSEITFRLRNLDNQKMSELKDKKYRFNYIY